MSPDIGWHSFITSANRLSEQRFSRRTSRAQRPRGNTWPSPSFVPCTTAWSSAASTPKRRPRAASSFPDTAKEKPQEGEVIAVGPGGRDESGKLIPIDLKAGDRVLFGKWSGTEVKIDGEDLLIMKESDIMGVIA